MLPKILSILSPTEWRLMRCVWDLHEANPSQVADYLQNELGEELSAKTVGIFLGRLEEKGYLRSFLGPAPVGRGRPPHVYSPLISYDAALRRQFQKFLDDHLVDKDALEALLFTSRDQVKVPN
jgi:predicted transcriptional regulator